MKETPIANCSYPYCYYQGILGSKPSLVLVYKNNNLYITHAEQNITINCNAQEALDFLSDLQTNIPQPKYSKIPHKSQNFNYGFMGYFSFEFGLKLLNIEPRHKSSIPDFYFIIPTKYQVLDSNLKLIHEYEIKNEKNVFELPDENLLLQTSNKKFKSNLTKTEYNNKLQKIKKLIVDGETYQVNFAQEWSGNSQKSAYELFSELHKLNPSPYEAVLHTANFSIISNSPECLFTKLGENISTYPIKGTLSRSNDPKKLLTSKKDQAELEMIVDLERNDLSKIAKTGSVKVTKHRYIESYTNVHHTLSKIDAKLKKNNTFANIISALFPGGSITGCPKHRTCQIIQNLEKSARNAYCGSLGFIDINGDSNFNILIRTITQIGTHTSFHSGGGITINSIDESEYEETLIKAQNLLKVLNS